MRNGWGRWSMTRRGLASVLQKRHTAAQILVVNAWPCLDHEGMVFRRLTRHARFPWRQGDSPVFSDSPVFPEWRETSPAAPGQKVRSPRCGASARA